MYVCVYIRVYIYIVWLAAITSELQGSIEKHLTGVFQ